MNKKKPWTGGTQEEYEAQHFGFGSQIFKIALREMVKCKLIEGIKNCESNLLDSLNLTDKDKISLKSSVDNLIKLYIERAESILIILDRWIEHTMTVPSNVLLPDNEDQLEQVSVSEYEKLQEEVALLKQRVKRGALMEAFLIKEEEELSALDSLYESANKDMNLFDIIVTNHESHLKSTDSYLRLLQNHSRTRSTKKNDFL